MKYISYLPAYEDGTECSETSAYNIQTPGYYPEESIQYSDYSLTLRFQTRTVSNSPPLNILTVPNWLTVKFHYSIVGSIVKILNTLFLLAVT